MSSVDVGTTPGMILITYGAAGANKAISGSTLELSASTSAGSIKWTCQAGTISNTYLPSTCTN